MDCTRPLPDDHPRRGGRSVIMCVVHDQDAIQSQEPTVWTRPPSRHLPGVSQEEQSEQQQPPLIPSDKTPEEFFEEMIQREDVRGILEELARGEAWRP